MTTKTEEKASKNPHRLLVNLPEKGGCDLEGRKGRQNEESDARNDFFLLVPKFNARGGKRWVRLSPKARKRGKKIYRSLIL